MAKTFNIELWEQLKKDFLSGSVFFGKAPQDTPAPYCVIHVLDSGCDEESKTLCGSIGEASMQFNIYGFNDMQLDELLDSLITLLKSYKSLENYRIIKAIRGTTKSASSFSSEVGMGFSRFDFSYEGL